MLLTETQINILKRKLAPEELVEIFKATVAQSLVEGHMVDEDKVKLRTRAKIYFYLGLKVGD